MAEVSQESLQSQVATNAYNYGNSVIEGMFISYAR